MALRAQYFTWGLTDLVISVRLKIRATEDLIECAQRLYVRADNKTERELGILKQLRDRTYDDINFFVNEREKKIWRLWENHSDHTYKPLVNNNRLTLQQLQYRVDMHLLMISYIEPRYQVLIADIPPYNQLNAEMIQLCTVYFGNEGWLQMFQIRQLRHQQEREQHDKQYMPPVDQIKKRQVDPYTIKAENEERYDAEGNFKSWWADMPEKEI